MTSWPQGKKSKKLEIFVKKNKVKKFKRALKAVKSIREVRTFTESCGPFSGSLESLWFVWSLVWECFPSIPVEQVYCLDSLEKILQFLKYLKYLWIRELKVKVKKMGLPENRGPAFFKFLDMSPGIYPPLTRNVTSWTIVHMGSSLIKIGLKMKKFW